jgi:hypothetical protein
METLGVIIGRFQTPVLTDAHTQIIKLLCSNHNSICFVILRPKKITDRNPFNFDEVLSIIKNYTTEFKTINNLNTKINYVSIDETYDKDDFFKNLKIILDNLIKHYLHLTFYHGENLSSVFEGFKLPENMSIYKIPTISQLYDSKAYRNGFGETFINKTSYYHGICRIVNSLNIIPIKVKLILLHNSNVFLIKHNANMQYKLPEFELDTIEKSIENTLGIIIEYHFNNIIEQDLDTITYLNSFIDDFDYNYRNSKKIKPICLIYQLQTKNILRYLKKDFYNAGYISLIKDNISFVDELDKHIFEDLI